MLSNLIKTIFLISFLMLLLIGCSEQKINDMQFVGTLTLENDTLYLQVDEDSLAFPFSDIGAYDTINCDLESDMTLYSVTDTLIFSPDNTFKNVKIIGKESTKIVTITYFNYGK